MYTNHGLKRPVTSLLKTNNRSLVPWFGNNTSEFWRASLGAASSKYKLSPPGRFGTILTRLVGKVRFITKKMFTTTSVFPVYSQNITLNIVGPEGAVSTDAKWNIKNYMKHRAKRLFQLKPSYCPLKGMLSSVYTSLSSQSVNRFKSTEKGLGHFTERLAVRQLYSVKSDPNFGIIQEITRLVGNPEWKQLLRDALLMASGSESFEIVDLAIIPTLSRFLSDEKLIIEKLMILLLSMLVNRMTSLSTVSEPTTRQTSIATCHLMNCLMLRVHNQLSDTVVDVTERSVQLAVLVGDLLGASITKVSASTGVPEIVEVLLSAMNHLSAVSFPKTKVNNRQDGSKGDNREFHYEDTHLPLQYAFEAIVLDSALSETLRYHAHMFISFISRSKILRQTTELTDGFSTDQNGVPKTSQASQDDWLAAMEHLGQFSECRERELLGELAHIFVFREV